MKIKFLGAARQVTGSCYYFEAAGAKMLVDCGMYQERPYKERNWAPTAVPAKSLDYVFFTHAHLDHAGLTPKLVKEGFDGTIYATAGTAEIVKIVLKDSGKIQEEDAKYKLKRHKKEGRTGPYPVVPLYTVEDAEQVLPLIRKVNYEEEIKLNENLSVRFFDAGHIFGSSMIQFTVKENGKTETVVFSGDIGQCDKPIIEDPTFFEKADYVIMESTYGDRDHEDVGENTKTKLVEIINDTVARKGNIVIPTFAIERAQELMYYLSELVHNKQIPPLMIFLDSPMAVKVTDVFRNHREYMDDEALALYAAGEPPFSFPGMNLVRTVEQSKAINNIKGTCIIMAGSGMCTGGRIKHHLIHNIVDPNSTILFVGYQAQHTLGRHILEKPETVRIHGKHHPVKARIEQIHGLSAHADKSALLKWITNLKSPPKCVFCTHGDEDAVMTQVKNIQEMTGWNVIAPEYLEEWSN